MKEFSLKVKISSEIPEEELVEWIQDQARKVQEDLLKDCRTESCDVSVSEERSDATFPDMVHELLDGDENT